MKANTTYKHDPRGIELLQSMQTLFEDNFWGIPGAGDCDCFTIAYSACMIVTNNPVKIVLAGNKKDQFSHVYNVVQYLGAWMPADLTEANFNQARKYFYTKNIVIW